MKKISKHLQDMLSKLPKEGEFEVSDLSPAYIYRAQWVVGKLTEAGYLERRVEWVNENNYFAGTKSFYKLIKI